MAMSKTKIIYIFLTVIFLFSLFLHFYKLNSAPRAVLVDEAANGYNAFSIGQTGRDEYGNKYPLIFKSFGDQKLPLGIYASVIPVKIFGLNALGTRFASSSSIALLSLVIFFLLKEIKFSNFNSLLGAVIATVSSWTFVLGRFGWESSIGLLFFSLALLFLLKSNRTGKMLHFMASGFFLGITLYSYIPYRLISLLVLLISLFFIESKGYKNKLVFSLIFLMFLIPTIPLLLSPGGSARFKQTTIFSNINNAMVVNDERQYCNRDKSQILCSFISNKPVEISYTILKTAAKVFSIDYLFISGDEEANYANVGKFALFPFFLAPFYLIGLFAFFSQFKNLKDKRRLLFLAFVMGICLTPALITKSPQRIQMSSLFPFFLIIIIIGYAWFTAKIKYKNIINCLMIFLLCVYGFLTMFYFINIHSKKHYGNEEFLASTSDFLGSQYKKVDNIYINSQYSDMINFYSYYNRFDPEIHQKEIRLGQPDGNGFQHAIALDKIIIAQSNYNELACDTKLNSKTGLYFTNQNVLDQGLKVKPLYIGKNAEGLNVGYVYNLLDLVNEKECVKNKRY